VSRLEPVMCLFFSSFLALATCSKLPISLGYEINSWPCTAGLVIGSVTICERVNQVT